MPFFSMKEQLSRAERIRKEMRKKDVDCAVTFSFHNSYYLSGVPIDLWGNYMVAILPLEDDPVFLVPMIDKERAEENSWIKDVRTYTHAIEERPIVQIFKLLKEALVEKGFDKSRIGLEIENHYDRLPYPLYFELRRAFPDAEFVDVSRILEPLRLVLSEEEVQVMRIAGEMGVTGMETFMSLLEEGATEKEVSAESTLAMEKMLAKKYPWCETTVGGRAYLRCTFGLKTLHVHGGGTGDSKLRKGYVVQANAIPFVNGYMCSLERTVIFGKPSDKQREAYEAMLEAREKGIEMLKPGVKCSDVYRVAKDAIDKTGYGKYIRHTLGHSHGILNWLAGWLRLGNIVPWDDTVLQEGMVTSMLLGVYVPKLGGFRHGDMFLITEDGHENLTEYDRGLLIKEPSI